KKVLRILDVVVEVDAITRLDKHQVRNCFKNCPVPVFRLPHGFLGQFSLGYIERYAAQTLESVAVGHRAEIAFSPNRPYVLSAPAKLTDPLPAAGNDGFTVASCLFT